MNPFVLIVATLFLSVLSAFPNAALAAPCTLVLFGFGLVGLAAYRRVRPV